MRTIKLPLLVVGLLSVAACAQPAAEMTTDENQGLYGGWIISEWIMPETEVVAMPAEQGLFLFTESGHYSMMWVPSRDRSHLPTPNSEPTDAQLAEAYMSFIANSGRYTVTNGVITYEASLARDAAYMSRFEPLGGEGNARSMSYTLNEDGTLTIEFMSGDEYSSGVMATLRRPVDLDPYYMDESEGEHN